jgi:hypothetical protein
MGVDRLERGAREYLTSSPERMALLSGEDALGGSGALFLWIQRRNLGELP